MNELLLRQVTVIDPQGQHHDEVVDILVRGGTIAKVGKRLQRGDAREVRAVGLHASPGWVESSAHFRDPGEEYKQGIANGMDAAAAGGFTQVAVLPSTTPVCDGRSGVEYLKRKSEGHAVSILPIGALTKGLKGEQLAEHFDMHQAGAVAFSDDQRPVRNTRLMLLALQYSLNFGGQLITFAQDEDLLAQGLMHEGEMSVRLGMRGIPPMAEAMRIERDLRLVAYTGARLHFSMVSTADGVDLIRRAKAEKLRVTASVAAHQLLLDDGVLHDFDSRFKVMPPLRDKRHVEALRAAVKEGVIDTISSDHRPEDVEHKKVEFPQAAFGAIGLETAYAAANTAMNGQLSVRRMVERFCHGPRHVLGLEVPHLNEGARAEVTLFDPTAEWSFSEADIVSRSKNSPFIGQRFNGRALGIVANGQARLSPSLLR